MRERYKRPQIEKIVTGIKKYWIHILAMGLIMMISVLHINERVRIGILDDEFGYWANAAYINGLDWMGLTKYSPFYSMGYSLLLACLMRISLTPTFVYQFAIISNGILNCLSYILAYKTLRIYDKKLEKNKAVLISLVTICFSFYIYQTQIAWAETLLNTLMFLLIYLIAKESKKQRIINEILILLCVSCMYIVHKRSIGIIAVVIVWFAFITKKGLKKKLIYLGSCTLLFVCILFISSKIDSYMLREIYYGEYGQMNVLDSSKISSGVSYVFSNIKEYFLSFVGKIFAALFSTLFIGIIPIVDAIESIIKKNYEKRKIIQLFVVLCFVVMVLLTAVQTISNDRPDVIVYTRYFELTMGPLVLLGLKEFYDCPKGKFKLILAGYCCFIFLIPLIIEIMKNTGNSIFVEACSPAIGGIYRFSKNVLNQYNYESLGALLKIGALVVICLSFCASRREKKYDYLILILVINLFIGYWSYKNLQLGAINISHALGGIQDRIEESNSNIYYLKADREDTCNFAKYLQFDLMTRNIQVVEDISEIINEKSCFLLIRNGYIIPEQSDYSFEFLHSTDDLLLFEISGQ